jgi:hypothetical protein
LDFSAFLRRIRNARSEGCPIDKDTGAWAVAWLGGAATSSANADQSRALVQLPRRNRPGENNRRDDRRQQCGSDLLVHDRPSFRSRFAGYCFGLAATNPHTPEVALGLLKTHPQPRTLGQGDVLVQKWCRQVVS